MKLHFRKVKADISQPGNRRNNSYSPLPLWVHGAVRTGIDNTKEKARNLIGDRACIIIDKGVAGNCSRPGKSYEKEILYKKGNCPLIVITIAAKCDRAVMKNLTNYE